MIGLCYLSTFLLRIRAIVGGSLTKISRNLPNKGRSSLPENRTKLNECLSNIKKKTLTQQSQTLYQKYVLILICIIIDKVQFQNTLVCSQPEYWIRKHVSSKQNPDCVKQQYPL